jgi:hypothetical protein
MDSDNHKREQQVWLKELEPQHNISFEYTLKSACVHVHAGVKYAFV